MTGYQIKERRLRWTLILLSLAALLAVAFSARAADFRGDRGDDFPYVIAVAVVILCFLNYLRGYFHEAPKHKARDVRDANLQFLGGNEATLLLRKTRRVSTLWSAWDNGLRGVANLRRILQGYGRAAGWNDNRPARLKWELRAWELLLGFGQRTGKQQAQQPCHRVARKIAKLIAMGCGVGIQKLRDIVQEAKSRMDHRAGDDVSRARQRERAGRCKDAIPTEDADPQRENDEHQGVGCGAWVCKWIGAWKAAAKWLAIICCAYSAQASAQDRVIRWAPLVTREAQVAYGLDAPVPMFLGQIKQESSGDEKVTARDGGMGLAQMMPATAHDLSRLFPELGPANPYDPRWAIRAQVRYDGWIARKLAAVDDCNRWASALAGYNGGPGYVLQAQRASRAPGQWFGLTEFVPTRQSPANHEFMRTYPRKILFIHQARYAVIGRVVCPGGAA